MINKFFRKSILTAACAATLLANVAPAYANDLHVEPISLPITEETAASAESTTKAASTSQVRVAAIDLLISIPDTLYTVTRSVSDGNPALEIIDTDAITLQNSFIQNDVYLEAFPEDLSYEIVITATTLPDSNAAGFNTIDEASINNYIETLKAQYEAAEGVELSDITLYENETTKYVVITTKHTSDESNVYSKRYYTVMNGYNYNITLQTDNIEIDENLNSTIKSIVDSAQYQEVKSTLSDNGIFNEFVEMFVGFGLTVLILGTILFMITRKVPKK